MTSWERPGPTELVKDWLSDLGVPEQEVAKKTQELFELLLSCRMLPGDRGFASDDPATITVRLPLVLPMFERIGLDPLFVKDVRNLLAFAEAQLEKEI